MNALLICPADRNGLARLADRQPLAIAPLLGKSVLEYWVEHLAAHGATRITILAADRPDQVRAVVGEGTRWGVALEVVPEARELTIVEARKKYCADRSSYLETDGVVVLDRLPGRTEPLFDTYAGWFAAIDAWMPCAATPSRVGAREIRPGVWIGLRAQVAAEAELIAPCWIGDEVLIGAGARIGPHAIIDDRTVVADDALVRNSIVNPETFVGRLVCIENSIASGSMLVNWKTESVLRVPDAFLLGPLHRRRGGVGSSGIAGRVLAVLALAATSPLALVMMMVALVRGEPALRRRAAVRPPREGEERGHETFVYYELTGAGNWLRRWPQFWSVACGDLRWVGNRPLRPTQAFMLVNDFERLWLTTPPGLVSLADASGCPEGVSAESCAHASYYAVNASRQLNAVIFFRALRRAALAWPVYWSRRRDQAAALSQLATKQQG